MELILKKSFSDFFKIAGTDDTTLIFFQGHAQIKIYNMKNKKSYWQNSYTWLLIINALFIVLFFMLMQIYS